MENNTRMGYSSINRQRIDMAVRAFMEGGSNGGIMKLFYLSDLHFGKVVNGILPQSLKTLTVTLQKTDGR